MRFVAVLLILVGVAAAPAARGQNVSPQLAAAVEAWLADDDAAALPAISALAASGDALAAKLLGRIAKTTPRDAESGWVSALAPADRAALFSPGGAEPLAAAAAAGDSVAAAFLSAEGPQPTLDDARTLHAAGEVEAARLLAWRLMEAGRIGEIATLPREDPIYADLDWLLWMQGWIAGGHGSGEPEKWVLVSEAKGRVAGLILTSWSAQFLAATKPLTDELALVSAALGGKPRRLAEAGPGGVAYAERLLEGLARRDPALRPLGAICGRACPQGVGGCMLEGLRRLGGYGAVMPIDSPLEAAVSQFDFTISARAQGMTLRLLRAAGDPAPGEAMDACLPAALNG